ncbi:hypothetical protein VHEMI02329 [[Torrubiella] hemipterigena]|uniref:Uncharacterized protein n=1 Tax=[Torrubiella] hemipterigena TaxID=1531966 RepID=A0A0A1SPB8_9HYPO|nr:hypothetical protein VHEMI02329 [[Torrubiella] hemipterigena]
MTNAICRWQRAYERRPQCCTLPVATSGLWHLRHELRKLRTLLKISASFALAFPVQQRGVFEPITSHHEASVSQQLRLRATHTLASPLLQFLGFKQLENLTLARL